MARHKSPQSLSDQPSSITSAPERSISERRIQANRRNALRSTGPKTERGKRAVARNAIKHGLLAREVVITAGDGEECLDHFHTLLKNIWDCYDPVGAVEGLLVQTVATCWWRKARVIRAENGELRKRLDMSRVDLDLRNSDKANLDLAITHLELGWFSPENQADRNVSTMDRWATMQSAQSRLRSTDSGLTYLAVLLQKAKAEIVSSGYLSEKTQKRVVSAFSFWDFLLAHSCLLTGLSPTEGEVENQPLMTPESEEDAEELRSNVLELIDSRLNRLRAFVELMQTREELESDAEARRLSLPPADATFKLLRYEAHLDRQLYRAMAELERLQRQRRGEVVPPPLTLNVNKRG